MTENSPSGLQHPRYGIPKTYRVKVAGIFTKGELKALEDGIDLPMEGSRR